MKITIDTKEDSHAEIQKVIKMLSSLVNGEEVMNNQGDLFGSTDESQSSDIFSDDNSSTVNSDSSENSGSSDSSGGGMFNMFNSGSGGGTSSESTTEETQENKEEKEDVDIDIPDVEEYH